MNAYHREPILAHQEWNWPVRWTYPEFDTNLSQVKGQEKPGWDMWGALAKSSAKPKMTKVGEDISTDHKQKWLSWTKTSDDFKGRGGGYWRLADTIVALSSCQEADEFGNILTVFWKSSLDCNVNSEYISKSFFYLTFHECRQTLVDNWVRCIHHIRMLFFHLNQQKRSGINERESQRERRISSVEESLNTCRWEQTGVEEWSRSGNHMGLGVTFETQSLLDWSLQGDSSSRHSLLTSLWRQGANHRWVTGGSSRRSSTGTPPCFKPDSQDKNCRGSLEKPRPHLDYCCLDESSIKSSSQEFKNSSWTRKGSTGDKAALVGLYWRRVDWAEEIRW